VGAEIKRGDVVLAIYPFTDLSSTKRRPALIVSEDNREGTDLIPAFITSKVGVSFAGDVAVDPSDLGFAPSGLRVASAIRCSKLMTLDQALLTGRLGALTSAVMEKVDAGLKLALGLS
jgi:mRNA interferase MazF